MNGNRLTIIQPLADAKIGIFSISTYDTDHIFVKECDIEKTTMILTESGHCVIVPIEE